MTRIQTRARPAAGIRRCGQRHTPQSTVWPAGTFTDEQIETLLTDPDIVVEIIDDEEEEAPEAQAPVSTDTESQKAEPKKAKGRKAEPKKAQAKKGNDAPKASPEAGAKADPRKDQAADPKKDQAKKEPKGDDAPKDG